MSSPSPYAPDTTPRLVLFSYAQEDFASSPENLTGVGRFIEPNHARSGTSDLTALRQTKVVLRAKLIFIVAAFLGVSACDSAEPRDEVSSPLRPDGVRPSHDGLGLAAPLNPMQDGLSGCLAGCNIDNEECIVDVLAGCDIYGEQSFLPIPEDSCSYQLRECRGASRACEADCFDIFSGGSSGDDGGPVDDDGDDDGGSATAGPGGNPCDSCPSGQSCHCEPFLCWPNNAACP